MSLLRKIKITFYAVAKVAGFFAIAKRLTAKYPRILCYHGGCLGDEWKYNGLLFMRASTFSKRIEWLQANGFAFMGLAEAVASAGKDHGSPAVVITFDDGWYSTGSELVSVLASKNLPSVLYLSTKNFLDGKPIISVALSYLFWKVAKQKVSIRGAGEGIDGQYHIGTESEQNRLIRNVNDFNCAKNISPDQLVKILSTIAQCFGVSRQELALESRRFAYLTGDEIRKLADAGCAIESHGHVHVYPEGEPAKFEEDLKQCAQVIESLGLPRPRHYCYPSGGYDAMAASVLEKVGLISATTCHAGLVQSQGKISNFYLPRFLDGENIHMLEFEAEMSGFSQLLRRFAANFSSGKRR